MNNKNWKITIEQYGCKYSVELDHSDVTTEEVFNGVKQVLLASSWHPDQVKEILNEDDE